MKRYVCCAFAAFVAVCGSSVALADNLVRDGGFERPIVPDGGLTRFSRGQKAGPWKVVGAAGTVDIISTDFTFEGFTTPAKRGVQWMDLTGNTNSATGVQQRITTTPSATYLLTFFVGSAYDPTGQLGTSSTVHLLIDGSDVASFTFKAKPGSTAQQWRKFSTEFVAATAATTIAFINGDPPNDTDNGVDVVSVGLAP